MCGYYTGDGFAAYQGLFNLSLLLLPPPILLLASPLIIPLARISADITRR
jgi:hypothetical protein